MEWFIACPRGIEELLVSELQQLGAASVRQTIAGAYASGEPVFAYRVCLWSRLANRVLLPLARIDVAGAAALYDGVRSVPWCEHLTAEQSLAVDFSGTDEVIRHTRFGAQTVKDGVVDAVVEACGRRPVVDLKQPDIRLNARLAKGKCVLSLDLSGDSLHRRGYRRAMVAAPLKENLAAALLLRAGWPEIANPDSALLDPMCGSGTLLLEGAMMAADIAPNLERQRFGFHGWLQYQPESWRQLRAEAVERRAAGLAGKLPEIRGYDKDTRAVEAAEENIAALQLQHWVRVVAKPVAAFKKPTHLPLVTGLVITNPPYGERWGEVEQLRSVYATLGERLKQQCPGWRFACFTGNPELAGELKLRADKKYQLYNGAIACQLGLYSLHATPTIRPQKPRELSPGAQMLANRLRKNQRKLQQWLKRDKVSCYRLYDSDLPEYAVAIDIYGEALHVQEYAPPESVDIATANRRLTEVKQALLDVFPDCADRLYIKERRRQKGAEQYQRRGGRSRGFQVREGAASLEVNLADYLDTGLFLDHRPLRLKLFELAAGKRFLNLFCYTAAVTVQAALGGASESLSVDLSNTYLAWAERNFALNNIDTNRHKLLKADCLEWLEKAASRPKPQHYDLIFLDPPTFSNSKMTASVLDIQRDHPQLIDRAMTLLAPHGTLFFSNNFRRFKMADAILQRYAVCDISADTVPLDFSRNTRIHNCWRITHDN